MKAVRWIARLLSLASATLLLMFMFGGAEHLRFTTREIVAVAFFPIGVIIGFGVAWLRPLLGAIISLGSLAVFYAFMLISSGGVPGGPYFLLFALPAILFLVSGLRSERIPG